MTDVWVVETDEEPTFSIG